MVSEPSTIASHSRAVPSAISQFRPIDPCDKSSKAARLVAVAVLLLVGITLSSTSVVLPSSSTAQAGDACPLVSPHHTTPWVRFVVAVPRENRRLALRLALATLL